MHASQEGERQERIESERQLAEATMRDELRLAFLRNPAATEADFEELYPELRRRKLIEDTLRGGSDGVSESTLSYYKDRLQAGLRFPGTFGAGVRGHTRRRWASPDYLFA